MKMRISNRVRLRTKLTKVVLVFSLLLFVAGLGLFVYLNLGSSKEAYAAVNNDYRSIATGNWNTLSTWQRYNGSSWVAATAVPSSTHNIITVQSGHTVTVTANATVDQVVISSGANLVLNSGITLTIANGTGTDFSVSGKFTNAGTVTLNSSATLAYLNGGTYQHNYSSTAGTIPTASWASGSTCEIIGYTSNNTAPSGMQSFDNFVWNCPLQNSTINLNGTLTTVNGNFEVQSTGSDELRVATNASTLNVGGNFIQSGGSLTLSVGSGITSTINVSGDFFLNAGIFSVVNGSNSTGKVNLSGNFTHMGGTLTVGGNSSTVGQIIFKNSGSQNLITNGSDVSGNVDFIVNSGSNLVLKDYICTGRNFTLLSGGGIAIGSVDGIETSGNLGNIQSSGTRSFNTGADYTYSGTAAQVSGAGLPATVRKLTINNGAGLRLNNSVIVSSNLYLTQGRIETGATTVHVSSTSTSSISGQSNTSYIIGNLRRSVSATGNYDFPLGTSDFYELISTNLVLTVGFSSLLATFENTDPLIPTLPLNGIQANNVEVDSMLNYGYWTLTPNSPITAGIHTVTLKEQGYTNNVGSKTQFFALTRASTSGPWSLPGSNILAATPLSGGIASSITSGLLSFNQYAIGYGNILAFANPTLIAGLAGNLGAIYKFPNVCDNVDAWMEITDLAGGATLSSVDNSGSGYNEAFQPFITIPGNSTASIQWRIRFKVAGTSQDTTLAKVQLTGVDVDGGSGIKEFVEATMPSSYALNNPTILTVTNVGGNYRATSNFTTVSNIDTAAKQAMYQLNYRNVNNFLYRTGAISTNSSSETRQTSLYFASFLTGTVALPVSLTYFNAVLKEDRVLLEWSTASEIENDYFTVERSPDGQKFEPVNQKKGAGNSTNAKYYSSSDNSPLDGYSYYRLKQTDYDGKYTYSSVVTIKNGVSKNIEDLEIQTIYPNPFEERFTLSYTMKHSELVNFSLLNAAGIVNAEQKLESSDGYNSFEFENRKSLSPGIYYVVLSTSGQKVVKKVMKK